MDKHHSRRTLPWRDACATIRLVTMKTLLKAADRHIPVLTNNRVQARNLRILEKLLLERDGEQRLLVLGAGEAGVPIQHKRVRCTLTDVRDHPTIDVLCDAHDLPFGEAEFDAVVAIAMLEHVSDPAQVVSEIHRVLKPDGLVYSEIPFLQRVHAGAHDYTRFTMLGHRRLFRMFDTIELVQVAGAASSLAWAINGFGLAVFGRGRKRWYLADRMTRLLFWWLPRLDRLLAAPASADSACGTAFLGRRAAYAIDDRDIAQLYRGAVPTRTWSWESPPRSSS